MTPRPLHSESTGSIVSETIRLAEELPSSVTTRG